ncbi:MAG: polysaccharide biosynthesis/export family protein, partial [Chitinophagales bacterium]
LLFPNRMFKQGNYEYFSVGQTTLDQYTIKKGDLLSLQIFSREGFDLIDVLPNETGGGSSMGIGNSSGAGSQGSSGSSGQSNMGNSSGTNRIYYLVEQDGNVELPLFGRTYVVGKTENELEDYIEDRCAAIFNEPYAILNVVNRRAFVFKGSEAAVVSLNQGPTTILEVIAKSGGLGNDLKAYKIKILRGDLKNPEIISIDLSTMEGLRNADLIVQSNDVIYIENRIRVVKGLVGEASTVLSLLSTVTTLLVVLNR